MYLVLLLLLWEAVQLYCWPLPFVRRYRLFIAWELVHTVESNVASQLYAVVSVVAVGTRRINYLLTAMIVMMLKKDL